MILSIRETSPENVFLTIDPDYVSALTLLPRCLTTRQLQTFQPVVELLNEIFW